MKIAAPAPSAASGSPRPAYPSDDPDLRAMQRVETRLRDELAQEHAVVHAAVAADETTAEDLSAAATEGGNPDLPISESPWLDRGAYQEGIDAESDPVGAPVEPGHDEP